MRLHEFLNENSLGSLVAQDQAERNEYKKFVTTQANGNYEQGAQQWAKLKNRSPDDIFGDRERASQFMTMKFDFSTFTEKDWENYWILAQHCDQNPNFQKQALAVIKQYQGADHEHYHYLYDRISCNATGKQQYGTQTVCKATK